ncbi:hypothetical protein HPP92_012381 [Vanilla planifolia]|uniref:Gnk2-homologous domain-containing protein n=1 Tax=Vanilla planifolia TaxID=51239 RepID=A0A835V1N8_VANPL|nr:hypothetical protein HPP92_012381 [Vanilla planifolia]
MSVSGYVGSSSSQIFALAQCRPGSPILSCTHCLMVSVSAIRNSSYGGCGLLSSAAAVFDLCFIRYSDQPVFGTPDYTYRRAIMSTDTTAYSKQFSYLVGDLLWRLSKEAAARASRFAVGVTDTNLQHEPSIYGLAWCTGDLSSGDCGICLPMAMDGLDFLRIGGRSAFVGCLLMYDIKVFFDMSFLNSTTSGRPIDHAGGNANGTRGKGCDSYLLLIQTSKCTKSGKDVGPHESYVRHLEQAGDSNGLAASHALVLGTGGE